MEEAPENRKELSHSAHVNGMNEYCMYTYADDSNLRQPPSETCLPKENAFVQI